LLQSSITKPATLRQGLAAALVPPAATTIVSLKAHPRRRKCACAG
jgi:hypothetical protein